ncbi:OmpA family protein [Flavobacterium faecale]|uniref:OmpA family protein n=1 Tax=Flavobacterium faecale TaxID=1355330 RepID=UPI003AAEDB6F
MKTKTSFIFFFILYTVMAYSQENTTSEIIISEENLISLIKRIQEKRAALFKETSTDKSKQVHQEVLNQENSYYISSPQAQAKTTNPINQSQLNAIYTKLNTLEKEINQLNALVSQNQKRSTQKEESVTVIKTNTDNKSSNEINQKYQDEIIALEKRINELKKASETQKLAPDAKPIVITQAAATAPTVSQIIVSSKDTIVVEKKELSNYPELVKKYGSVTKPIYFENNSVVIDSSYHSVLNELKTISESTDKIDFYIHGYASQKGSPIYNERLSMRRTENVKKHLILKGIHPSRILTQYHGVDYSVQDESLARRVEIKFMIRK